MYLKLEEKLIEFDSLKDKNNQLTSQLQQKEVDLNKMKLSYEEKLKQINSNESEKTENVRKISVNKSRV